MEASRHPIRLVGDHDLRRSRLLVFFRLPLAFVHVVWLLAWGVLVAFAALFGWLATLVRGQLPLSLHRFLAAYVRYWTHLTAFLSLGANPFPGFTGRAGSYPVDVEIDPPVSQNRWTVGFRLILAVPAVMLASVLAGSGVSYSYRANFYGVSLSLMAVAGLFGWWVALFRGMLPAGFRDAIALSLAYSAQQLGYMLLLTDCYPNSDPEALISAERPADRWTELESEPDDGRRNRWAVFFRLVLVLPLFLLLSAWGVLVFFAVVINWFVLLVRGSPSRRLHHMVGSFVRYETQVTAYSYLLTDRYPPFLPETRRFPVDVRYGEAQPQNRWKTFFRLFLAIPAFTFASAYGGVLSTCAFLGWFASLFTARMPTGLRKLGLAALNYTTQAYAYGALLTDQYPHTGPVLPRPVEPVA